MLCLKLRRTIVNRRQELLDSIRSQQWNDVQHIIDDDRKLVDQLLTEDDNILLEAIQNNAPEDVVKGLVSLHVKLGKGHSKLTLHGAVRKKRWELVPVLLRHGADVNLCDCRDKTPLHLALEQGAPIDIITSLLSSHNINNNNALGNTAFHKAVILKRWDLVPVLLQHGADINLRHCVNQTPLYMALHQGVPSDIATLLISPRNINMEGPGGYTVLQKAMHFKRWDLVPVLLQHGADINFCNRRNVTPLHLAVQQYAPVDIVTQLISPHNINIVMKKQISSKRSVFFQVHNCTALHLAVTKERWDLVPVLLQNGAKIPILPDRGDLIKIYVSRLVFGAYKDASADVFIWLVSFFESHINTLLQDAVRKNKWDMIPVMLQYGADPDVLEPLQSHEHLVRSLTAQCISTIRSHMPVKSDEAYEGLGLPGKLVDEAKLRPQAKKICGIYTQ